MSGKAIGRALAASVAAFAMLCPWVQPAFAQQDQSTERAPETAQVTNQPDNTAQPRDAEPATTPVVDADGYQQWKDSSVTTDEGIGWKIDEQGTLHIRPWTGDEGTTGSASVDSPLSDLPWYTRRKDIKNIESTGTIHLNANSDLLFYGCENLESLEGLSDWDASKLVYGRAMFQDCTSLKNLHGLEHWQFASENGVHLGSSYPSSYGDGYYDSRNKGEGMFQGCSGLTDLSALSNWRFPHAGNGDISGMFQDCTGLTNLHGLEHWNVGNLEYLSNATWYPGQDDTSTVNAGLFSGCSNLTDISALADWKLTSDEGLGPNTLGGMFQGCVHLTTLNALSHWELRSVMSLNSMFRDCTGLTDASAVANWYIYNVQDPMGMFYNCPNLERIGIPSYKNGGYAFINSNVPYGDTSSSSDIGLNVDMPQIMREDGAYGPWTWEQLSNRLAQEDDDGEAMLAHGTVWVHTPSWIIDYNSNGGMGSMPSSTTKLKDAATLPRCTFLRFGYEFIGWSTQPTDTITLYQTGDSWRPADPKESARYTLYAQWKKLGSSETGPISGDSGMLPGWVQYGHQGTQGTIPPNAVANAQFTNHYAPGAVTVTLKFTKLLDGNVPGTQFDFQLLDSSGKQLQTARNVGAIVQFDPLWLNKAGEYTYFVNETGVSDTVDMDTHPVEVKITVTDDEQNKGNLKAVVQLTGDTTFRNTTKPASIELHKTVTGTTDTSKDFTFKVTLTGHDKQAVSGTYSGVEFRNGVGTVHLRAGGNATISGIPAYTNYRVEETDLPAGYALASIDHATGTLQAAGHVSVTAANTYQAKPAVATLNAAKYVQYGTGSPLRQMTAGAFRFSLCEVSGDVCNDVSEAPNAEDGSVVFPQLTYDAVGKYVYHIREQNTHQDGVTYDGRAVTATVDVTDDGTGQLQVAVAYSGGAQVDGADGAHAAVFVNQSRQMSAMPQTGSAPWVALLVAAFVATFVMLCMVNRRHAGRHSA
ncbi:peptidase [Bifidobacterium pseudolongum subsp. globosum]|uniref:Peptidase n=1 Tax=Bifidobacterium pseudolongum subsp. globosum TaxID=1690 RepID=A0A4Q5A0R7_9BIFI|nr:FctA domain-containing protein [Bifidobacterium pseudolongum]RYQ08488.1 peptidase [Bifidobacterium pseudolongum subsp. globosum]